MAVAVTSLVAGAISATDSTSFTTGSFTITSGRPVLLCVVTAEANPSTVPTITASNHGSTYTWTQEGTDQAISGGVRRRVTIFSTLPGSTNTDTITVNTGSNTSLMWSVQAVECTGANTSDIVRQFASNAGQSFGTVTVTLAAMTGGNATFGFWALSNTTSTLTVGTGFTQVNASSEGSADAPTRMLSEFLDTDDTTVDAVISGSTVRNWVGCAVELNVSTGANVTGIPAEAAADGVVPVFTVNLGGVLATATADGITASLPAVVVPTGILGDTTIKGPAVLTNFVLANPEAPSSINITALPAEAVAATLTPTFRVTMVPLAATAIATADDPDPPVITVTMEPNAVASATAVGVISTISTVIPVVTATAIAVANVATINTSNDILGVAASAIAETPSPVVTVGLPSVVATATAVGMTVTLDVVIPVVVASAVAEAPVPVVGILAVDEAGEVDLRAIARERVALEADEREVVELDAIARERAVLDVEAI